MKYAIVIPDGAADEPQDSLDGKTPLQAASTPAMDEIVRTGRIARASNVPAHLPAGSDVATMSLLGYDPETFHTGRAPLEAAAMGIELGPEDFAVRCNLVTIQEQQMKSFTAGHISSEEARALFDTLRSELSLPQLEWVPGVSYRNLLVVRGGHTPAPFTADTRSTPPHDLTDKPVVEDYPRGPGSDFLCELMSRSMQLFGDHPVNQARAEAGKPPATNVWLWGLGKRPAIEPFAAKYGVEGAMITAVDLLRGMAVLAGWRCIEVPGATGYLDTDYAAKGRHAVDALDHTDLVCVHVEAPDEASHEGRADAKVEALEQIDQHIVGPLLTKLQSWGDFRMLVSPDHPTLLRTKTHSHGFVPAGMCGNGISADAASTYDEIAAAASPNSFDPGWRFIEEFIGK